MDEPVPLPQQIRGGAVDAGIAEKHDVGRGQLIEDQAKLAQAAPAEIAYRGEQRPSFAGGHSQTSRAQTSADAQKWRQTFITAAPESSASSIGRCGPDSISISLGCTAATTGQSSAPR